LELPDKIGFSGGRDISWISSVYILQIARCKAHLWRMVGTTARNLKVVSNSLAVSVSFSSNSTSTSVACGFVGKPIDSSEHSPWIQWSRQRFSSNESLIEGLCSRTRRIGLISVSPNLFSSFQRIQRIGPWSISRKIVVLSWTTPLI
jgi:hypothetical protein